MTTVWTTIDIADDKKRRQIIAIMRCQNRYRVLAVRLKRIAKARGVTPEELLDGMERPDA